MEYTEILNAIVGEGNTVLTIGVLVLIAMQQYFEFKSKARDSEHTEILKEMKATDIEIKKQLSDHETKLHNHERMLDTHAEQIAMLKGE